MIRAQVYKSRQNVSCWWCVVYDTSSDGPDIDHSSFATWEEAMRKALWWVC